MMPDTMASRVLYHLIGEGRGGDSMGTRSDERTTKPCSLCGRPIPRARLEAVPGVTTCVECARKNATKVDVRKYDLSQASPINRNGFAPSD